MIIRYAPVSSRAKPASTEPFARSLGFYKDAAHAVEAIKHAYYLNEHRGQSPLAIRDNMPSPSPTRMTSTCFPPTRSRILNCRTSTSHRNPSQSASSVRLSKHHVCCCSTHILHSQTHHKRTMSKHCAVCCQDATPDSIYTCHRVSIARQKRDDEHELSGQPVAPLFSCNIWV